MTAVTLRNLERGNSGVTVGAYLAVMQVLGAEQDLDLLLKVDAQGRELQDAALSQRSRRVKGRDPSVRYDDPAPITRTADTRESSVSTNWNADDSFVSADNLASLIKQPEPGKRGRGK